MLPTLLTSEERADVATHHLQHRSSLPVQPCVAITCPEESESDMVTLQVKVLHYTSVNGTCVFQRSGRGIMLHSQDVEEGPQGTRVTSESRYAALTADPSKLLSQEHA